VPSEELRERRGGIVADAIGDFGNPMVTRLEKHRRFLHSPLDQIAKHRLTDELAETGGERGSA